MAMIEYPKMKHRKDGATVVVHTPDDEKALDAGWKDSPAEHGKITAPSVDQLDAQERKLYAAREAVKTSVIQDVGRQDQVSADAAEKKAAEKK
jgi:hypothetical protein